jgi:hypothetical protein
MNVGDEAIWFCDKVTVITNEFKISKGGIYVVVRGPGGIVHMVKSESLSPLPSPEYAALYNTTGGGVGALSWISQRVRALGDDMIGYLVRTKQPDGTYKYELEDA